jgi:Uma2 family endonuclease
MMSVSAPPKASSRAARDADIPDVPIYRLSVEQYHAMARAGILDEDAPVELLEGWLVRKMTKHRPHSVCTQLTGEALKRLVTQTWYVASQEPVTTTESEPEPDLAVIRGNPRDYPDRQPGPADVPLVVEVAESSLETDRNNKKRIYARAGIPVYWIANLVERKLEVYTDPTGPADLPDYRQLHDYGPADELPVVLDGVEVGRIPVREMLP